MGELMLTIIPNGTQGPVITSVITQLICRVHWHGNVNLYGISSYESFHNVRSCRRGGGVSIFVKNDITCNRRDDLAVCYGYVESFFAQLDKNTAGHTKNVILGVVYRPPNQDVEQFINSLKYTIDNIMHENKICYLMGDMNVDVFNHGTHSSTGQFLNTFLQ